MNNLPAFPTVINTGATCEPEEHCPGMSLRDYFAAHAVIGLIIRSSDADLRFFEGKLPEAYAESAYKLADSMLAHREKQS